MSNRPLATFRSGFIIVAFSLFLNWGAQAYTQTADLQSPDQSLAESENLKKILQSKNDTATETQDLLVSVKTAEALVKKYGRNKVLVVFDLDNTLLTLKQELGSVPWFDWQSQNLSKAEFKHKVAEDFNGLLNVAGKIYALAEMKPTQNDAAVLIKRLQDQGIATFILTARGSEYRNATERELEKNGFDFSQTAPGPQGGIAGRYLPYDEKSAKLDYHFKNNPFKAARKVSYMDGIYMTAGQNKGLMLSLLLKRLNLKYSQVVFVDDGQKNIDDMLASTDPAQMQVHGFRYGRLDKQVERFFKNPDSAIKSWVKLSKTLNQVFPAESI